MTGNVDHYATLTVILLTFTFSVNQGQGQKRTCDLFSRPHPRGLCGTKLAKAHDTVCFLIRQSYPQFFPQNKRSPALDGDNLPLPPLQHVFVSDGGLNLGPAVFDAKKTDAKSAKAAKPVAGTPKKEGSGGKAKKKKWSKGKVRDKLNNLILFDMPTYDKLYKEVPSYKLITPSVVSERLKKLLSHREEAETESLHLRHLAGLETFLKIKAQTRSYAS